MQSILFVSMGFAQGSKASKKVLFVVSSAHFYGTSDIPTGNSFSEIVLAYDPIIKAGYEVDFVSPKGGSVSLAYINTSDPMEKQYLFNCDFMYTLKNTKSPDQIDATEYKAVYYVGGGGAMFGVPENTKIQQLAMNIYEEQKGVVSAICHGTAGIVNLKTKNGKYLVSGKRVNGFPEEQEDQEREYFKQFPFLIGKTIEEHGGDFKFSKGWTPHLEVDGRLITGQNPPSVGMVADKIIEFLNSSN